MAGQFTYLINDTNFDDLAVSTDGVDASNLGAGVATATVSSSGSNTMVVQGADLTLASAMFSTFATIESRPPPPPPPRPPTRWSRRSPTST